MKIIDSFLFFNEFDMLDLRLNILDEYVDEFVLVESEVGFTGKPKRLFFNENKHKFEKYLHKIKHVITKVPSNMGEFEWYFKNSKDTIQFEFFQRNSIIDSIKDEADDSVLFISDLDEIWDPCQLIPFIPQMDDTKLYKPSSKICYFYFNLVASPYEWVQPVMLKSSLLKKFISQGYKLTQDIIRNDFKKINDRDIVILKDAGWHFSFTADVIYKIQNSAHTMFDKPPYNTREYIDYCIKNKTNPFHGFPMSVIPEEQLNDYLPSYVLENMDKYQKYILLEKTI